jgi:phosphatidylinositol alpha-1,6-mannosyltransferase
MKVLLLTQDFPPRPGGMARYYADWARGLGPECTVAVGSWQGQPPQPQGDARLLPLPVDAGSAHRPLGLRRAVGAVGRELDRGYFEVLIAGNVRPYGPPALGLARRAGLPLVLAYHGNDLLRTARRWRRHPWKRRRWTALAAGASLHVVNSAFTAALAEGAGLPRERIAVVPPEVDDRRFRPAAGAEERAELRTRFGFGEADVVTLFVGRLVERKGLDDLFAALSALPGRVRLAVAGPGETASWRGRAEAAGVADRVRFLGKVAEDDLPLLYRAADVFAAPSRDRREEDDVEGFGIVFLEAAASGLAVLATRTGGIPEAVEDGVGGLLVPPGDRAALTEAWTRLVSDRELRRRLGARGRAGRARTHGAGSSAQALREALEGRLPA